MERDIAKTCPLCGKDNRCGLLGQNPTEPCWCTQEVFPSKLLERVPEDSKGKACICRECLEKFQEYERKNGKMDGGLNFKG